jgi:hypothetical protein
MEPGPNVEYADRACNQCRQRRVKCDKRLPLCLRCEKLGRPCSGYDLERKFLDEGVKVRRKYDGNFQFSPDLSQAVTVNPNATTGQQQHTQQRPQQQHQHVQDQHLQQRINLPSIQEGFNNNQPPSFSQILSPPLPSYQSPPPLKAESFRSITSQSSPFTTFGTATANTFSSPPPSTTRNLPAPFAAPNNAINNGTTISTFSTPPTRPQISQLQTDYRYNTSQEPTTAKLLAGKAEYDPLDLDVGVDEDYFDLDIEEYYARGNNACGFIPGLPVILTDNNVPEAEDDFLTNDFASVSGRSSIYDG